MSTTSRTRSDPGGGVVGCAIVLLTLVAAAILRLPAPVYYLLIALGTVLALKSAGLSGFGLATLVLVIIVFVGLPVVSLVLTGPVSPDLKEPIPVPAGYGLVLQPDSTNVMHVYASKTLLGDKKAVAKAQPAVLDYYAGRLQDLGWKVVSLGDSADFKAPDSDVGIHVETYPGLVHWGNGAATLVLQIQAESCPDDKNYCVPARITDVKPYTG